MKRLTVVVLALLLLVAVFSGCGGGSSSARNETGAYNTSDSYAPPMTAAAPQAAPPYAGGEMLAEEDFDMYYETELRADSGGGIVPREVSVDTQKMVYTASLSMQAMDFDEGVPTIERAVESFGGFIQDSYIDGYTISPYTSVREYSPRNARLTARVPAEKLNSFIELMQKEFNLVNQSMSVQNISSEYYDTQARLDSLYVQRERLMEMLEQSNELKYLLTVEQQLAEVTYKIESLTSTIRRMDSEVGYSTVSIHLQEVLAYDTAVPAPATFSIRAATAIEQGWKGFGEFLQGLMIFILYTLPLWIVLAVIIVPIVLIVRRKKSKHAPVSKIQEKNQENK